MNDVMLICDSAEQANYEFELFKQCFPTIVRSSNKKQRKIVLNDGEKIFFENSNHGKTAFVGIGMDVFEIRAFKKALKKRLYEAVEKIVKEDPENDIKRTDSTKGL